MIRGEKRAPPTSPIIITKMGAIQCPSSQARRSGESQCPSPNPPNCSPFLRFLPMPTHPQTIGPLRIPGRDPPKATRSTERASTNARGLCDPSRPVDAGSDTCCEGARAPDPFTTGESKCLHRKWAHLVTAERHPNEQNALPVRGGRRPTRLSKPCTISRIQQHL